jgi:hypothetical protein
MTCPSDVSERRTETAKACRACDGTGWKEWAIPDADGDTHGQPCPDCPRSGEAMQVNDEGPTLNSDKPKERNLRSAEAKESKWPCFYCGSYQAFHVAVHAGGTVPACETHKGGEWRRSNEAKDVEHNPRSAESSGSSVLTPDDRPVPGDSRSATPVRATSGDGLPREANQPPGAAVLRFADGARVRVKGGPHTGRLGTVYDNVFGESKVQLDGDSAGHWWDNSLLDELTSEAEMLGLYPLPPMNRCTYVIHDSRGGDRRCTRLSCHTGACDYEPERRMYCSKCSGLTEHAERCPDGARLELARKVIEAQDASRGEDVEAWASKLAADSVAAGEAEYGAKPGACKHTFSYRCTGCGALSDIDDCVATEREEAIVAFRKIVQIGEEHLTMLVHGRRRESAPPRDLTARAAAKLRYPLDGADAQALEHALTITERELNALQATVDVLRRAAASCAACGNESELAALRKVAEAVLAHYSVETPPEVVDAVEAWRAPSASPLNPRVEPPTDTCGLLLHSGRRCTRARGHLSPSHWSTDPDVTCEHPMHRRQGFPNGIWCCDCGALWLGAETGQPGRWRTPGEGPR